MQVPAFLRSAVIQTPLWPILRPRSTHLYGVGAPKTGTHSITKLFASNYRSGHEAHVIQTTDLLKKRSESAISYQQLAKSLRWRDRRWRLECESAHFLGHFCDVLAEVFPQAKFILTVREPHSWLRSILDQDIKNPRSKYLHSDALREWATLHDLYFGRPPEQYAPREEALAEHGLRTLDGYLSYWARHNRKVLDTVPRERLLVIRTRRISDSLDRIAAFAGVPAQTLDAEQSHANKAPEKHGLLSKIDEKYIQEKIAEHCSHVTDRIEQVIRSQPSGVDAGCSSSALLK